MRLPLLKRTLDRTFLILCPVEQCEPMMNLLELAFPSGKRTDPAAWFSAMRRQKLHSPAFPVQDGMSRKGRPRHGFRKLVVRYGGRFKARGRAQALLDRAYSCGGVVGWMHPASGGTTSPDE